MLKNLQGIIESGEFGHVAAVKVDTLYRMADGVGVDCWHSIVVGSGSGEYTRLA